jgi:glucokinase
VTGLAIDIGASKIAVALVTEQGVLLEQQSLPTRQDQNSEDLYTSLYKVARSLQETCNEGVAWCGVGCAGPLDLTRGLVSPINIPAWNAFSLRERLEQDFSVPVALDLDAKALALGEGWRGAAQGVDNYMAMVVSSGIGAGIVVDGHILDGRTGNAGHIGHIVAVPGGRRCVCGVAGCLEAEASGLAILAKTGRPPRQAVPSLRQEVGRLVGETVAQVVTVLDLELVLVAGSVALGFGQDFFDSAQAALSSHLGMPYAQGVQIRPVGLGASAPLIGAASIARAQGLFGQQ